MADAIEARGDDGTWISPVPRPELLAAAAALEARPGAAALPARSVFGDEMISGGSSSGSALAVALGEVPLSVATDTAGSGRVPAALNGIVGWKPSRGMISAVGLVPASKSLDCITLMATTVDDLDRVFAIVNEVDPADPWARPRGPRYDGRGVRIGLAAHGGTRVLR